MRACLVLLCAAVAVACGVGEAARVGPLGDQPFLHPSTCVHDYVASVEEKEISRDDAKRVVQVKYDGAASSLRSVFFVDDLYTSSQYCTKEGQQKPTFMGGTATCTSEMVLSKSARYVLEAKLIPAVQGYLYSWVLLDTSVENLPALSFSSLGPVCKSVTVPAQLTTDSITGLDAMFFVAVGASTLTWATSCTYDQNGRPLAGVLHVAAADISDSDAAVRLVLHQVVHGLGFSRGTFAKQKLLSTASFRGKTSAPVFTGQATMKWAQGYYGCSTLPYVELEDAPYESDTVVQNSSHWKRRNAVGELMTDDLATATTVSELTLSALWDLGFYTQGSVKAETWTYGQGVGCKLFTDKCVSNYKASVSLFCSPKDSVSIAAGGCVTDSAGLQGCEVMTFASSLPSWGQYFGSTDEGGPRADMDYCPIGGSYLCTSSKNPWDSKASDAYCLVSGSGANPLKYKGSAISGVCAEVKCHGQGGGYTVSFVDGDAQAACDGSSDVVFVMTLKAQTFEGTIRCPPINTFCNVTSTS